MTSYGVGLRRTNPASMHSGRLEGRPSYGELLREKKLVIASPRDEFLLFAGHSNPDLAHKVA